MRRYAGAALGLAIALAVASGCGGGSGPPAPPARHDISDGELQAMLSDGAPLVVLDVRTAGDYESGHIPGSVNIPVADLPDRIPQLDQHTRTVCVCWSGARSRTAADLLVTNGFTGVYNLEDGLSTWDGAWESGCPVCSSA
ncbi:MAG: rhodanese-like domain-containing protein [Armatimonadota bacterium]